MKSLRIRGAPCVLALMLTGCGGSAPNPAGVDVPLVQQNLRVIRLALHQACQNLGRGPESVQELRPFLQQLKASDEVLRSPRDGMDFVIVWGVDVRRPDSSGQDVIVVYEKAGGGDGRYVIKLRGVEFVPEADFPKARFPQGHIPRI